MMSRNDYFEVQMDGMCRFMFGGRERERRGREGEGEGGGEGERRRR